MAAAVSHAARAANDPSGWQVSKGAAGDVGEHLLDDRVAAVLSLGLEITSSNGEWVRTAWCRQTGNSSSCPNATQLALILIGDGLPAAE